MRAIASMTLREIIREIAELRIRDGRCTEGWDTKTPDQTAVKYAFRRAAAANAVSSTFV